MKDLSISHHAMGQHTAYLVLIPKNSSAPAIKETFAYLIIKKHSGVVFASLLGSLRLLLGIFDLSYKVAESINKS